MAKKKETKAAKEPAEENLPMPPQPPKQPKEKKPKAEKQDKQTARLQRIAEEAAKQCGRARLPIVKEPISFKKMLDEENKNS